MKQFQCLLQHSNPYFPLRLGDKGDSIHGLVTHIELPNLVSFVDVLFSMCVCHSVCVCCSTCVLVTVCVCLRRGDGGDFSCRLWNQLSYISTPVSVVNLRGW